MPSKSHEVRSAWLIKYRLLIYLNVRSYNKADSLSFKLRWGSVRPEDIDA